MNAGGLGPSLFRRKQSLQLLTEACKPNSRMYQVGGAPRPDSCPDQCWVTCQSSPSLTMQTHTCTPRPTHFGPCTLACTLPAPACTLPTYKPFIPTDCQPIAQSTDKPTSRPANYRPALASPEHRSILEKTSYHHYGLVCLCCFKSDFVVETQKKGDGFAGPATHRTCLLQENIIPSTTMTTAVTNLLVSDINKVVDG